MLILVKAYTIVFLRDLQYLVSKYAAVLLCCLLVYMRLLPGLGVWIFSGLFLLSGCSTTTVEFLCLIIQLTHS